MLSRFKDLGVKIIIKIYYVFKHIDRFPANLGDVSEEHGESLHQDMMMMKERYQAQVRYTCDSQLVLESLKRLLRRITIQKFLTWRQ